jgi:hypothetical protein
MILLTLGWPHSDGKCSGRKRPGNCPPLRLGKCERPPRYNTMTLLALRFILLAWVVAAIMFGLAHIAEWGTSCAEWPHCAAIITDEEIIEYYMEVMVPH